MKMLRGGNISGPQIRAFRLARRMSQAELAERMRQSGCMIDQEAVSRMERGKRIVRDFELAVIADIFCVTVRQLTEPHP